MEHREEKRKYIRLNSIFPIEFQLVSKEDRQPISELYEGFTRDVGKGGMGIFVKALKDKDKEAFKFIPHETKLKVIINIPLDKEPIESFATIEWAERQQGPITDTYLFGISYDFINELEYEKIVAYAKWLRLKPKLILLAITLLVIAFTFSLSALFRVSKKKIASERALVKSVAESQRARGAEVQARKEKSEAEIELEAAKRRQMAAQLAFEKVSEKKKALEEISKLSEEDKRELQFQLEDLAEEKALLEERIEREATEAAEEIEAKEEISEASEVAARISSERLRAEEQIYDKFRELILNEKIQSLSAYVSSHRSSIYHAAGLFALAELRYKYGEQGLSTVSYNQLIELYPESKYALYSSHRLDQLDRNDHYERYTLKDFYDNYNLPELFDYRNIRPYAR